jgi:hypothetical protein
MASNDSKSGAHRELVDLLTHTILSCSESITQTVNVKWGVPTFIYKGNLCNIVSYKKHVNLHFFNGAHFQDPENLLQGTGKGTRHLSFQSVKDMDIGYIKKLVRLAMTYNEQNSPRLR